MSQGWNKAKKKNKWYRHVILNLYDCRQNQYTQKGSREKTGETRMWRHRQVSFYKALQKGLNEWCVERSSSTARQQGTLPVQSTSVLYIGKHHQ